MNYKTFDNLEEMFDEIQENQKRADEMVHAWQRKIKEGDYFFRDYISGSERLAIFGKVVSSPYPEDREMYEQPHLKNHRMTRCYSVACPAGEFGDVHIASITSTITEEMFEEARDNDWSMGTIVVWLNDGWVPDCDAES